MKKSSFLVLFAMTATAHAGGKPLPGLSHDPPRFVDESTTWVQLNNHSDSGYGFQAFALIAGYGSSSDGVHLDWTQNGKVLATTKCQMISSEGWLQKGAVEVKCNYTDSVKAKGAIDALLIYRDDKDDKEYLIRDYKVDVRQWDPKTWQIAPDDVIASAYVYHRDYGQLAGKPVFRFWATSQQNLGVASLRCTVDGKQLPDFAATFEVRNSTDGDVDISADIIPPKGDRTTWHWRTYQLEMTNLHFGTREKSNVQKAGWDKVDWMVDHPGAWDCNVRQGGRNVREFLFTVNSEGIVESHAMQKAKGAVPLFDTIAEIDVRIPKEAAIDQRIKPDVLRKSRGFGLPWPEDPSVKATLAALPPAVETMKLVVKVAAGKRLSGLEHSPPRFVDESTTEVRAQSRSLGKGKDGYVLHVFADVSGFGARGDQFHLEVKQGGAQLATTTCSYVADPAQMRIHGVAKDGGTFVEVTCDTGDKLLTATGAIDAALTYHDDQDGNDYVLRTYSVNVVKFTSFGDPLYQIVPDDLLGVAYIRNQIGERHGNLGSHVPHFMLWVAHEDAGTVRFTLRCSVDGTKLENDVTVGGEELPGGMVLEAIQRTKDGKHTDYRWKHLDLNADIVYGPKDDASNGIHENERGKFMWLVDHPGKWDCMLRSDGKGIREFLFTVDDKGNIADAFAGAKHGTPNLPEVVQVEMRIPKDGGFDNRIRPDAMRKSRGFGLPWPDAPVVKGIHAAFPPASGLPDPR